eukprot:8346431-Pyramimonas_sp.AAC.1
MALSLFRATETNSCRMVAPSKDAFMRAEVSRPAPEGAQTPRLRVQAHWHPRRSHREAMRFGLDQNLARPNNFETLEHN